MQSPKARYQLKIEDVAWHKRIVESLEFERAADAAMLTVARDSSEKIAGAKAFLEAFVSLSVLQEKPKEKESNEIDYKRH